MAFPNRALITAPVARDLSIESGVPVARIPGATNGTLQLWDTLDEDYFAALNDPQLTIYGTLQAIPAAVRKYCVQFHVYSDALGTVSVGWKRWVDCTAIDFIKVTTAGVPSVVAVTAVVAGNRPQEWDLLHRWAGNIAETLGAA